MSGFGQRRRSVRGANDKEGPQQAPHPPPSDDGLRQASPLLPSNEDLEQLVPETSRQRVQRQSSDYGEVTLLELEQAEQQGLEANRREDKRLSSDYRSAPTSSQFDSIPRNQRSVSPPAAPPTALTESENDKDDAPSTPRRNVSLDKLRASRRKVSSADQTTPSASRFIPCKSKSVTVSSSAAHNVTPRSCKWAMEEKDDLELNAGDIALLSAHIPDAEMPLQQERLKDLGLNNLLTLKRREGLPITGGPIPEWPKTAVWMSDLRRLPRQTGRDWRCTKASSEKSKDYNRAWKFWFRDASNPNSTFSPVTLNNIPDPAFSTQREAQELGTEICEYLNRWPIPLPYTGTGDKISGDNGFWPVVGYFAFLAVRPHYNDSAPDGARVLPKVSKNNRSQNKPNVVAVSRKTGGEWMTDCVYPPWYDRQGSKNAKASMTCKIALSRVKMDIIVPSPPEWWPLMKQTAPEKLNNFPAAKQPQLDQAVKLTNYIFFRMYGALGDREEYQRASSYILNQYAPDSHRESVGPAARQDVARHKVKNGKVSIYRFKEPKFIEIMLNIRSRSNVAFVLDKMIESFFRNGTLYAAFQSGSLLVDLINIGKVSKTDVQTVISRRRREVILGQFFHCQLCIRLSDASQMDFLIDSRHSCVSCSSTEGTNASDDIDAKSSLISRLRVLLLFDRERHSKGSDFPLTKEDCKRLVREFEATEVQQTMTKSGHTRTYKDMYANVNQRPESRINALSSVKMLDVRWDPFQASPDGIFPVSLVDSKLYHHASGNIAVTALYLNCAKSIYIPALLQVLADYQRLRQLKPKSDSEEVQQVYRKLDHIYVIGLLTPHKVKSRLSEKFKEELPTIQRQWFSAVADPTAHPSKIWSVNLNSRLVGCAVPFEELDRVVRQMEKHFMRSVPRNGPDGAPWPFLKNHMPKWWSYQHFRALMAVRFHRMDWWCDWSHRHNEDSVDTLIIECIRQWLDPEVEEYLGLEMTIYERSPICFAVAHLHHKMKMQTGCKTKNLSDFVFDRDYEAGQSNISFESQTSNYMKSDFDESRYAEMLKDLEFVDLPAKYYERPTGPVKVISQLEAYSRREPVVAVDNLGEEVMLLDANDEYTEETERLADD